MWQMSQINIIWYVANVFLSSAIPRKKFKINEYTSFADLQYEMHNLIPYGDNKKIVKLEYCSPST